MTSSTIAPTPVSTAYVPPTPAQLVAVDAAALDERWHGGYGTYQLVASAGHWGSRHEALEAGLRRALVDTPAGVLLTLQLRDRDLEQDVQSALWCQPTAQLAPDLASELRERAVLLAPRGPEKGYLATGLKEYLSLPGTVGMTAPNAKSQWPRVAAPQEPVRAGCDGSKGPRARGGWAWVTTHGTYGYGLVKGPILLAELTAIARLLAAFPGRDIDATSDSTDALDAIREDAKEGQIGRVVQQIRAHMEGRSVHLSWVRGHTGDPLNDGADRLAHLIRYASEMGAVTASSGTLAPGFALVRSNILADVRHACT